MITPFLYPLLNDYALSSNSGRTGNYIISEICPSIYLSLNYCPNMFPGSLVLGKTDLSLSLRLVLCDC